MYGLSRSVAAYLPLSMQAIASSSVSLHATPSGRVPPTCVMNRIESEVPALVIQRISKSITMRLAKRRFARQGPSLTTVKHYA